MKWFDGKQCWKQMDKLETSLPDVNHLQPCMEESEIALSDSCVP